MYHTCIRLPSAHAHAHVHTHTCIPSGAFDLFHVGHIAHLAAAKALGSYLIVGVHDDRVVNRLQGENLPILNLHERVLSVLACRYVDEGENRDGGGRCADVTMGARPCHAAV